MTATLTVDDLELAVRWSERRKTLGLTVDRGGELIVSAPPGTALGILEAFVREKRFWLYTKLAEKEALRPTVTTREFVTGEGFPYLGRRYRLLLVDEQEGPSQARRRTVPPQASRNRLRAEPAHQLVCGACPPLARTSAGALRGSDGSEAGPCRGAGPWVPMGLLRQGWRPDLERHPAAAERPLEMGAKKGDRIGR